ncbi:hypothetical protein HY949_04815 [Candidatus Gottesmanbacteria bacterium]|nr:hypothetical protein [Candidatus Gottesmanbacteria bacterium]
MTRENNKRVIVSGQVFVAFVDRAHPNHGQAVAFFRYFSEERYEITIVLTSLLSIYETLGDHIGLSVAHKWLKSVFMGTVQIIYPDEQTVKAAIKLILTTNSYNITIDQAIMNVVADRRRIPTIATFEFFPFFFGIKPFMLPL